MQSLNPTNRQSIIGSESVFLSHVSEHFLLDQTRLMVVQAFEQLSARCFLGQRCLGITRIMYLVPREKTPSNPSGSRSSYSTKRFQPAIKALLNANLSVE